MAGNSLGNVLVLTTFGESHGIGIGGVLDGFPSNFPIDMDLVQAELNRRNPTHHPCSSSRKEDDKIEILSGIYEGKTTGGPIAFIIRNHDHRPEEYSELRTIYRPSHADYTYHVHYGFRDHRGGGRSSARTTAALVAGGAFARMFLASKGINFLSYISQIGPWKIDEELVPERDAVLSSPVACPDPELTLNILSYLEQLKATGDTSGGTVICRIAGVQAGLGEPVFDKLQADLAKAMMSINGAKGFEIGSGFRAASMKGSEHNDPFTYRDHRVQTTTNHSGGIQGGISNGMEIFFRVAFKPVSSIAIEQSTVDQQGFPVQLKIQGRHDVCMAPRAIPVVESMAALVIADHFLRFTTCSYSNLP